jgi:citrate lyase subunit beta / citryl-CoA lyase
MSAASRPRRSVLFMPASNARALEKARSLGADGLIFDLEDVVAPDAKPAARESVARALASGGYGARELFLRVNALSTPWGHADLVSAAAMPIDAVVLPKVESAHTVQRAREILERSGAPASRAIWCMIETPRGVLRAEDIAAACLSSGGLIMGTADLTKDLHARHTSDRAPLQAALQLCLLAARAYGLPILDGVHLDVADDAGFAEACRQGRDLGFDGKTLIHPKNHRYGERDLRALGGGGRAVPPDRRRARRGGRSGEGRGAGGWTPGGELARRRGYAHRRSDRGD